MVPTLTVKNIPQALYDRLKQSAAEHRRSINSEILVCLERALHSERVDPQAILARADALRERAALSPVTDELLTEARARMARPSLDDAADGAPPTRGETPDADAPGGGGA